MVYPVKVNGTVQRLPTSTASSGTSWSFCGDVQAKIKRVRHAPGTKEEPNSFSRLLFNHASMINAPLSARRVFINHALLGCSNARRDTGYLVLVFLLPMTINSSSAAGGRCVECLLRRAPFQLCWRVNHAYSLGFMTCKSRHEERDDQSKKQERSVRGRYGCA